MQANWTVVRIRGHKGLPELDGAGFLGCVASIKRAMDGTRWHFRWVPAPGETARDGLRVELPHGSAEMKQVVRELERRIPPPDSVFAEPLRRELDLDDVQTDEEMDACLEMLWRYSEFIVELRSRNPGLTASRIESLTPGAFLTFVTGNRRHLEIAFDEQALLAVPAVPFGKAVGLIREADLEYRVPPTSREEACAAARIHHLAGCTFASRFYPFSRIG